MNTNFYVVDFHSLAQFTRLNFFKALTPESTIISILLAPLFLCLFFFVFFFEVETSLMAFIKSCLSSPCLRRMCTKVKACNQIQVFTPVYIRTCNAIKH